MLVPPDNFGMVEPGIYRCSKLEADNFAFLETLQLKSLVLLNAEKPPRTLRNFLETNKVELFNLGGLKISNHHHTGESSSTNKDNYENETNTDQVSGSDKSSVSKSDDLSMGKTLDVISLDTSSRTKNDQWMLIEKNLILGAFGILFNKTKHNLLLVDLTLTLVGILRKIQKWNLNSIVNEYRIYTGNSNKSNYYAQTFLELVQTELIPYEVDQLNQHIKRHQQSLKDREKEEEVLCPSPYIRRNSTSRSRSIDEQPMWDEDKDDTRSIDDDEMDEDMLSASPQIPANLLKLVEMKQQEKSNQQSEDEDTKKFTPGSSPNYVRSSRNNSFNNDMLLGVARANMERRRSSIDTKIVRAAHHNKSFRNNSPSTSFSMPSRSFENALKPKYLDRDMKKQRIEDFSPEEIQAIRDKHDYNYYKNFHKYPTKFENVGIIKLKLPPDHQLPDWFIRSRNHWEFNFQKLNRT